MYSQIWQLRGQAPLLFPDTDSYHCMPTTSQRSQIRVLAHWPEVCCNGSIASVTWDQSFSNFESPKRGEETGSSWGYLFCERFIQGVWYLSFLPTCQLDFKVCIKGEWTEAQRGAGKTQSGFNLGMFWSLSLFFTFSTKNICITYIIRRKVQFPVKFSIQFPIYST